MLHLRLEKHPKRIFQLPLEGDEITQILLFLAQVFSLIFIGLLSLTHALPKPDFTPQPGDDGVYDHDHAHAHDHGAQAPASSAQTAEGKKCRLERADAPNGPLCFNEPECQEVCAPDIKQVPYSLNKLVCLDIKYFTNMFYMILSCQLYCMSITPSRAGLESEWNVTSLIRRRRFFRCPMGFGLMSRAYLPVTLSID